MSANARDGRAIDEFLRQPSAPRLAALVAADGAVAALDEANVLDRLLDDASDRYFESDSRGFRVRMALVPALVDAGVDINRIGEHGLSALARVMVSRGLTAKEQAALVRQLIAAGADPQLRRADAATHGTSAAGMLADLAMLPGGTERIADLRPLLEPALTDDGRTDALIGLLTSLVRRGQEYEAVDAWLADLVTALPTLDLTGPEGLAPVHLAALTGNVDLLHRILARVDDPDIAVAGTGRLYVEYGDSVRYEPGMTAIDLVDRALLEIDVEAPQALDWTRDDYHAAADRMTQCRAALVRAGGQAAAGPPPRPAVRSMDLMDDQDLAAQLVAGRTFYGALDREVLETMCAGMDALAQRLGVPLVVLYTGHVDDTLPDEYAHCVVGVHIAQAVEAGLTEIAYDDIAAALHQAEALPWGQIADQIPEGELRDCLTEYDDGNGSVAVYGAAIGMLAGFQLCFGVPVDVRDADGVEDDAVAELLNQPGGLAQMAPDLEVFTGRDQSDAHSQPVYGIDVAFGDEPLAVDFSAEAHKARVVALGRLAGRATYYLTCFYD